MMRGCRRVAHEQPLRLDYGIRNVEFANQRWNTIWHSWHVVRARDSTLGFEATDLSRILACEF
jgi:hypothetical protein